MARKSRVTSLVLDYIAKDDSAIGVSPEDLDEAYAKYAETKDITTLKLKKEDNPCIYRVRVFNTQKNWESVREAFSLVEGAGDGIDPAAWSDYLRHAKNAIRDRIVGVVGHPVVKGIDERGQLEEVVITWHEGDPEPKGLVDDILSQDDLVASMFQFLVQAATLTEAQKKG